MIERALISVYDKSGLEDLIPVLVKHKVEILSSGGTALKIIELGYEDVIRVEDYTGYPESPGGLVKTLHPRIHGGLLLTSKIPDHGRFMVEQEIKPIDLVVVNLYPFEETVASGTCNQRIFENIDIGGPTMIRSAAKASLLYEMVTVVVDPTDYAEIIQALNDYDGTIPFELKRRLAVKAFNRTADYEKAISGYLEELENGL
jgi:phosphoribosylaminoimidazolecarboxamide formyltransferase/IMP cyclohydrolase